MITLYYIENTMRQSIQDIWSKFKSVLVDETVFMAVVVLLVAVISFGLGRFSVASPVLSGSAMTASLPASEVKTSEIKVETTTRASLNSEPASQSAGAETGEYVGSKNGTKFHLLTCPGAGQIKEENKVYFSSKQEAYSQGYTEAANCKGI